MKRIHTTHVLVEVEAVRSYLESQGIGVTVEEDRIGGIALLPSPAGTYGVYVVKEEDFDLATECMERFLDEEKSTEAAAPWKCDGCGEVVEPQFTSCWKCGGERSESSGGVVVDEDFAEEEEEPDEEEESEVEPEEEPRDSAGQTLFWPRFGVLVLLLVPLHQAALLLSSFIHEVFGHGFSSLLMGGTFEGVSLGWQGGGWAWAFLPIDASPAQNVILSASGILATAVFGLWFLRRSFRRWDRFVARTTYLFLAGHCLEFGYVFWNSWHPVAPGDVGTILSDIGVPWIRWLLMIVSFPLMVGMYFWLTSLIYQRYAF